MTNGNVWQWTLVRVKAIFSTLPYLALDALDSGNGELAPLTSVLMKLFECLILAYFKQVTDGLLDPLQLTYRANRHVDDTINIGLHYIYQHLYTPRAYARILFVDFSSAFNTIISKLLESNWPPSTHIYYERLQKMASST